MKKPVALIECPRDAMQGWRVIIPTDQKIKYIDALLRVGFHTIDCGSFVSAHAVPQMADTREVLKGLSLQGSPSKLLVIVANPRGAAEASVHDAVNCLGYPFSISETFQLRNTHASIAESLDRVAAIQDMCLKNNKQLVIYISMGFGNPYGDEYSAEVVYKWIGEIAAIGVRTISLADTVGLATPEQVEQITRYVITHFPDQEIGVHLHSGPEQWKDKIDAALQAGCRRMDGALKGIGGCPMAADELVGNINTERLVAYLETMDLAPDLDPEALQHALSIAGKIFI